MMSGQSQSIIYTVPRAGFLAQSSFLIPLPRSGEIGSTSFDTDVSQVVFKLEEQVTTPKPQEKLDGSQTQQQPRSTY